MTPLVAFVLGAMVMVAAWVVLGRWVGFAAQRSTDYAAKTPAFDIRRALNGPILCEGAIYGPLGRVESRFVAQMNAAWDGNRCRMTEDFTYDSGMVQTRVWTLRLDQDGTIHAEAPDLIGTGAGQQMGSAVQLRYRIRLPAEAGGHVLSVIDWMYLAPNGTIINRSQFRKFGIKVAELVATMRPA